MEMYVVHVMTHFYHVFGKTERMLFQNAWAKIPKVTLDILKKGNYSALCCKRDTAVESNT